MYSRFSVLVVACGVLASVPAGLGGGSAAEAACLNGTPISRCVNLSFAPDPAAVSTDTTDSPAKPPFDYNGNTSPYTGPTFGLTPNERRAPTIGYRWSVD
jgi:hypothetical protein